MISSPHTTLIRVDPDKHMDRRYSVAVQATLLDTVAVVCVWGSRRSGYQRLRVLPAKSVEEAAAVFERIVQAKMRRGYRTDGEEAGVRDPIVDPYIGPFTKALPRGRLVTIKRLSLQNLS